MPKRSLSTAPKAPVKKPKASTKKPKASTKNPKAPAKKPSTKQRLERHCEICCTPWSADYSNSQSRLLCPDCADYSSQSHLPATTCVIVKFKGKLAVAQRTGNRLMGLKMSIAKMVVDPDVTPTRYDKDIVLVEAPMPARGLPDHVVEAVLNHSFCSSKKLYFLELLCPWILPITYDFLTNKYAPSCIDLTEDEDNGRVIKKRKPLLQSRANLITIGPTYWVMILSFLHVLQEAPQSLITTFVATSKELYQSRSYLLSRISLTIQICDLHHIRDCNPSHLRIFDFCEKTLCPKRFDVQHLQIVQAMTKLRNLSLNLKTNVSLMSLDQVQTLHIDSWKTSQKPMFSKSLICLETYATRKISSFHGVYDQIRSLKLDSVSNIAAWNLDSRQFPNLLRLDITLKYNAEFPDSLPPKLQLIRERGGCNQVPLGQLVQCKDLQVIDIRNLGVDKPLLATDGFPNLKILRCGKSSNIWSLDFLQEWNMQSLIELRVQSEELKDISALSTLFTLQTICLIDCVNVEKISPLIALSHLNTLELWYCDKVQDFESLVDIRSLKHVHYASQKAGNVYIIKSLLLNSHVEISIEQPCPLQSVQAANDATMIETSISAQVHF